VALPRGVAAHYSRRLVTRRRGPSPRTDPWRDNELARRARLREAGRRPLAVNLAEAMELSEFLCSIAGAARGAQRRQ